MLTTGTRPIALAAAVCSLKAGTESGDVVVVSNGGGVVLAQSRVQEVRLPTNIGVPAGHDVGLRASKQISWASLMTMQNFAAIWLVSSTSSLSTLTSPSRPFV